ncbi:hypothetical protein P405_17765 [Streptomyces sp. FR-008]|nr:hypothetical protein P405_17765 [Streptomyces sp. FR-008]
MSAGGLADGPESASQAERRTERRHELQLMALRIIGNLLLKIVEIITR